MCLWNFYSFAVGADYILLNLQHKRDNVIIRDCILNGVLCSNFFSFMWNCLNLAMCVNTFSNIDNFFSFVFIIY